MTRNATIIVITLNRPDYVRRCLDCLVAQTQQPNQIIVVDASPDKRTYQVVQDYPAVLYLRNENGIGRMTASRNIGLKKATGDIIAFVDDDAFAHPNWLENLVNTYTEDSIGTVGGQALNNQPGELALGLHEIGRLHSDGTLTGYFAADPGKIIEVDHVMGCNMSYRREVIAKLGGFREDYPGISGLREDTDMCLRVKKLGYKVLFNPKASVLHLGAPQVRGQRFDLRYSYYHERNHVCLLIRNFGLSSEIVRRYLLNSIFSNTRQTARKIIASLARWGFTESGAVIGLISGIKLLVQTGSDPVRHDYHGQEIARAMLENTRQIVIEDKI